MSYTLSYKVSIRVRRAIAGSIGIALLGLLTTAHAAISQTQVIAPGGFVAAYAGMGTGSAPFAGGDLSPHYGAGYDAEEVLFSGTLASASASFSGPLATNSASGFVAMGVLGFQANNVASNQGFGQGAMNGGWRDTIVIDAPGLTGQAGVWQFNIGVDGTLHATGFAGSASFSVTAYKNGAQLMLNAAPGFDPGSQWSPFATDRQASQWGRSTFSGGDVASAVINDMVTFAVPFVYGQSFDLGVYGMARAGKRSSSGVAGSSTSDVLFNNTLFWAGTAAVLAGGAPVLEFDIAAASGTDWVNAVTSVPLPAPVLLACVPLVMLASRYRRVT